MTDVYQDWPFYYPDMSDPDECSGRLLHDLQSAVQEWFDFHKSFPLWVERDRHGLAKERDRLNELLAMIDDPYGI